ncbi:MAG: hypothetical protein IH945_03425, partial [Armatimonadetes bacterium]|nr:hypothetical protein [Armatimonadota bacterium]
GQTYGQIKRRKKPGEEASRRSPSSTWRTDRGRKKPGEEAGRDIDD